MDVAQALEDVLEDLVSIQKDVNKLKTASVSGQALRKRVKERTRAGCRSRGSWRPAISLTPRSFKRCRTLGQRS